MRAGFACTVANNTISCNNRGHSEGHPHFGVRIGSDPKQFDGQYDFASSQNRVVGNDIIGVHASGVLLNAGTTDNIVRGNRIAGAAGVDVINGCTMGGNIICDNGLNPGTAAGTGV